MKFSIVHPTARVTEEFASPWWMACESALLGCDSPRDVEYILVVHHSRRGLLSGIAQFATFGRIMVVTNYGRDCLVDQCNAGQLAASGEIVIGNQDDMRYPEHWDTEILKLIPDTSLPMCVAAQTDGARKDLLSIPSICTQALLRLIGLTSTDYESMFMDDEWSIKAHKFAGVISSRLYFQHLHPVNGTAESDAVYELENRKEAYRVGFETFEKRRALGFPRVPYPGENPATVPVIPDAKWPILAQCFAGSEFSGAWLDKFLELGQELRNDPGYLCKRYRGYTSNVYQTRINLAERVLEDAKISGDRPKYVLWMDDDNIATGAQLRGLLKTLDAYPHVSAIAGWCWIRKGHGWTTSVGDFWAEDGAHVAAFNLDALLAGQSPAERFAPKEIEHTGFPFLLMRYEALEQLGQYAFRPMTKADLPAYFAGGWCDVPPVQVADHWFCGEDTAWCLQAKKAGMTILVDPGCKVGHLKLQLQEPLTTHLTAETPLAEVQRSTAINGAPVVAPSEYERVR